MGFWKKLFGKSEEKEEKVERVERWQNETAPTLNPKIKAQEKTKLTIKDFDEKKKEKRKPVNYNF